MILAPRTLDEALALRAEHPEAVVVAGGTDVMVAVNFGRLAPESVLDLGKVEELKGWWRDDDAVFVGAGMTFARIERELPEFTALAEAAASVGSPQIRNRGTIGGNLGSASPAGDCHPALLASGAEVEVESVRGARRIPIGEFFTGVKRSALAPDELIAAVWVDQPDGPEQFAKIGTRNAMVIAVAAFGLALHPARRAVGTGIGSAAPTPVRAGQAEEFLAGALDEAGLWESRGVLPDSVASRFGELVSAAAQPIDDVRGTAAYRRHALTVLARRTLTWAWDDYRRGDRPGGPGGIGGREAGG